MHAAQRCRLGADPGHACAKVGQRAVGRAPQHVLEVSAETRLNRDRVVAGLGEGFADAAFHGGNGKLLFGAGGNGRAGPLSEGLTRGLVLQRHRHGAGRGSRVVKPQKRLGGGLRGGKNRAHLKRSRRCRGHTQRNEP